MSLTDEQKTQLADDIQASVFVLEAHLMEHKEIAPCDTFEDMMACRECRAFGAAIAIVRQKQNEWRKVEANWKEQL
jgi:hypothetical protein